MTLQINFDKGKEGKLLKHVKWLLEVGLIKSYNLDPGSSVEEISTEKFVSKMIEQGEKDFREGNFMTHEEVKQKIKQSQANKK